MSQFNLPLDSAALDRLENKDLDRVRESAYQDLIEQGRAALVLRDELASRRRDSAPHTTHHDDCGCQYAALNALLNKQRTEFAAEIDRQEARIATLEAELAASRLDADLAWKESGALSKERNEEAYQWMKHANALRDALEKANAAFNAWGRDEDGIHPEAWPAVEHLREVLLATPAASLAALKADVLEPYKAALRVFIDNGDLDTYEDSFGVEVRALAAQAATHSVPDGTSEVKP